MLDPGCQAKAAPNLAVCTALQPARKTFTCLGFSNGIAPETARCHSLCSSYFIAQACSIKQLPLRVHSRESGNIAPFQHPAARVWDPRTWVNS